MLAAVVLIVAEAPLSSSGWTLLTRFVQIVPPRRLGKGMKFFARASRGARTALSFMNSRSIVLRAASRVMLLLTVTRTVWPGLRSIAMLKSPGKIERGSIATHLRGARGGRSGLRRGLRGRKQVPMGVGGGGDRAALAGSQHETVVAQPPVNDAGSAVQLIRKREVGTVRGVGAAAEEPELIRRG